MIDINHLPNELPDEKVAYFLRRHPITVANLFFGYAFILIVPLAALGYIIFWRPDITGNQALMALIVLGGSILFLMLWLFLFMAFIDYYLDMWVVTNKRILNIEQNGLFSRRISELRLYRVQDVTATVTGAIHTVFNYGDVEIQTAGERERFDFEDVPNPSEVAKAVLQLSELDRHEHLDEAVEDLGIPVMDKAQQQPKSVELPQDKQG